MADDNRVRPLQQSVQTAPGDGYSSQISADISAVQTKVDSWKDDECSGELKPLGMRPLNCLEESRRLIYPANDRHRKMLESSAAMTKVSAAEAGRIASQGAMWRDKEMVAAAASASVIKVAQKAASDAVALKFQDAAVQAAADFETAFQNLANGFQRCYNAWARPDAMKPGDFSIESIHRQTNLQSEIETSARPASDARAMFAVLIEDGDPAMISIFMRAARAAMRTLLSTPQGRLASELPKSNDSIEGQYGDARLLINEMDRYRASTRPASLVATAELLGVLRQLSSAIFGSEPPYVVAAEFAIRNKPCTTRDIDSGRLPWTVSPTWIERFLPPNDTDGWSMQISTTRGGAIVRMPANRGA